jgi:hypothetical protein
MNLKFVLTILILIKSVKNQPSCPNGIDWQNYKLKFKIQFAPNSSWELIA